MLSTGPLAHLPWFGIALVNVFAFTPVRFKAAEYVPWTTIEGAVSVDDAVKVFPVTVKPRAVDTALFSPYNTKATFDEFPPLLDISNVELVIETVRTVVGP
jgi:hypothetical protein